MAHEFLRLEKIHKSFAGVHALRGVDFSIQQGEIHCLVGENGSGKSTLIKIISGVLHPDSGRILVEGRAVASLGSAATMASGIQVIYQDLSLFPNLTVAENIAIAEVKERGRALVNWKEIRDIARAAMARIQVDLDLEVEVGELPIGKQQLVAICRALTSELKLLILDEPTSSLPKPDIDHLLAVVRDLQAHGIAVLFVSHKLNEVFEVAERITVLRDGERVATLPPGELDDDRLVGLMTGRTLSRTPFAFRDTAAPIVLEVRGLSKPNNFEDISFQLRAGEIVALIGLIGSGRTELALALFGISPAARGEIRVEGNPVPVRSVQEAVAAGIAYVPENRLVQGLVMKHSVEENLTAPVLDKLLGRLGLVDPVRKAALAREWIQTLGIKVADPAVPVQTLSGGNQQRVVIAKWLAADPRILILDGPTVGVDVMAKGAIHQYVRDLAARGMAVLLITDEIPEAVVNANRILIMRAGRIRREIDTVGLQVEEVQQLVEART
ncbi:MAG TPA: sugar ABC transporter ATP-binding protein [Anaeromyxobacter sp.]|nr:sugar ABC transporter ATP-binding protein [Anaeromyxobacter sp.]